ncbi:MAG: hypothetical protein P8N09_03235 [Planctomycetota bacterium]|nr:hypothetical protein [Planctomycetota bacterium]
MSTADSPPPFAEAPFAEAADADLLLAEEPLDFALRVKVLPPLLLLLLLVPLLANAMLSVSKFG